MKAATDKLKELRERAGLSKAQFSARLGYSFPSGYQRYEDETSYTRPFLPLDLVQKAAGVLKGLGTPPIDEDEVYELAGVRRGLTVSNNATRLLRDTASSFSGPSDYIPVRVAQVRPGMGAGAEAFAHQDGSGDENGVVEYFAPQLIEALRAKPSDLWVMQVEGQSMSPYLESGDSIMVDSARTNPSQPGVFVVWDGFGMVCKWAERVVAADAAAKPSTIRLISQNPLFAPVELTVGEPGEAEAYVMGRVVWMSRKL